MEKKTLTGLKLSTCSGALQKLRSGCAQHLASLSTQWENQATNFQHQNSNFSPCSSKPEAGSKYLMSSGLCLTRLLGSLSYPVLICFSNTGGPVEANQSGINATLDWFRICQTHLMGCQCILSHLLWIHCPLIYGFTSFLPWMFQNQEEKTLHLYFDLLISEDKSQSGWF